MSWLKDLSLTIGQWITITLLAIVGALMALLKVRGAELHRAKVDLLKAQLDAQTKEDDQKIATAKEAYEKALAEWEKMR
jgi:uncharacterized protein GlcG (DUF336 family)